MSLDFFNSECCTTSNKSEFGLCDNPDPSKDPAYINETDRSKWIGIVINTSNKKVDFYAIDHCSSFETTSKKSDGVLKFENSLLFIELKERGFSGWLSTARKQLTKTINMFHENNPSTDFEIEAYVCNSLSPQATKNHIHEIQKFKDDTGLILRVQQKISI